MLLVLALVGVAVVGCTPDPPPPPPPTPSYTCRDFPRYPCTATQVAREKAADQAHHDAETAVKAALAETFRMLAAGETKPTPTLKKYVGAEELNSIAEGLVQAKKIGNTVTGAPVIAEVRFLTDYPKTEPGSTQKLKVCQKPGTVRSVDQHGKPVPKAPIIVYTITATRTAGQWKQTFSNGDTEVKSCAEM